ncbi:MAG: hypothetical protein Q9219_000017 [cf. Caloplaca sp. 3 TL-2023]
MDVGSNYDNILAKEPSLQPQNLEVSEFHEAWKEEAGDLSFSHTKIILQHARQYYYATTPSRISKATDIDLSGLKVHPIPASHIWPTFSESLTLAPDPLPRNHYIKRPSLIHYDDTPASVEFKDILRHEAEIYELLMTSPHPNVGQYMGCIVHDGRIVGLCLEKYDSTLLESTEQDPNLDRESCWMQIQAGIQHIHSLGLVHGDLNPMNIMMRGNTAVIIDFDSCQHEGSPIRYKEGTLGWMPSGTQFAERKNDEYSLSKLFEFLFH